MWLWVSHLFLYKNTKRKVPRRKEKGEVKGRKEGRKQPKKQRIGSDQRTQDERGRREGKGKRNPLDFNRHHRNHMPGTLLTEVRGMRVDVGVRVDGKTRC